MKSRDQTAQRNRQRAVPNSGTKNKRRKKVDATCRMSATASAKWTVAELFNPSGPKLYLLQQQTHLHPSAERNRQPALPYRLGRQSADSQTDSDYLMNARAWDIDDQIGKSDARRCEDDKSAERTLSHQVSQDGAVEKRQMGISVPDEKGNRSFHYKDPLTLKTMKQTHLHFLR